MVKMTEALGTSYFCISWEAPLTEFLSKALTDNETVDIRGARFVPSCAQILSNFYVQGVKMVGGTQLMMNVLEENKRRAAIVATEYPTVLALPKDADGINSSILQIPKNAKLRIASNLTLNVSYLAYIAVVCICRPDVDLFFENCSCTIMEYLSGLLSGVEGGTKWWCLRRGTLCYIEADPSTGLYDMGEFGMVDVDSLRTRFKAIPYEFGTKPMMKEWKAQLGYAMTTIINGFKREERNTLYGLISEED